MEASIETRVKTMMIAYSASIEDGMDMPIIHIESEGSEDVYMIVRANHVHEALAVLAQKYGAEGKKIGAIAIATGAYMTAGEQDATTKKIMKTGKKFEVAVVAGSDKEGRNHALIARITRKNNQITVEPHPVNYEKLSINILDDFWELYRAQMSDLN